MRRDILVRGWSQCTWRLGNLEASVVLTLQSNTTEEPLLRKLWNVAALADMKWIAQAELLVGRQTGYEDFLVGNKKRGKLQ